MSKVAVFGAACAALASALVLCSSAAFARHHAPSAPQSMLAVKPYQRIAIGDVERVPIGSEIEVVGYFSHKSPEIDGDLEVYLIDHHGYFIVVEAPRRYRSMKYDIRALHLHRNELVFVRGTLTQQRDKPTTHYVNGWMEMNPVETIRRYAGPVPPDLHYLRVVHRIFGGTHVTQI
ncbi:MAG TPA: hypothetical protein VGQ96_06160 [Candidatus Eremiobacteraceae bacterium]|nr:hypothetical protein [Candidatus Eremiobacteraceae bacterium]